MLDTTTKRNIDSARDILVGKVPDPKAQVEQITTALIYKFMDDMDKESQELGGEVKFFKNGFEKFSWTKLLDKRFSGQERLELYVQAITSMSKNPNIPQLFRDIFKDAFLPYRDPETLSLFLKEIDKFSYDHSENLGNAFEYLLSVLGSQGDAGQFRTPRHIIDFIVKVVDPQKNETILDPACGTAGFLISAYKHILKQNTVGFNPENEKAEEIIQEGNTAAETILERKVAYGGNILSPAEKEKLMDQLVGYDISPDMVKLSLVNMYLHGFPEPKIYEYDTLANEKRWNDQFDVILANPPFMSPRGGIRPHKRFSVQASRSEVLFVDYILEHLNLNGRAGIIVPEGIIFKNETAYKKLRQMLIEDGLFAVVSLPPGVFNPYSGVKTSILFFDNTLAKRTDEILFIKIENDGFDLGAQRRKIEKNDLPEALKVIENWKSSSVISAKLVPNYREAGVQCIAVKKSKIAESGDYNLIGERYREVEVRKNQKWPEVELGEVAEVIAGQSPKGKYYNTEKNGTPFYQGKSEFQDIFIGTPENWTTQITKLAEKGDILMSVRAPVGPVNISTEKICIGRGLAAIRATDINPMFLFYNLRFMKNKIKGSGGAVFDSINQSQIKKIKIPLPPLEVQKEIVEQIEVKQNAINHAKEVIKNLEKERKYFGEEIRKMEGVEWVELGKVAKIINGRAYKQEELLDSGKYAVLRVGNFFNNKDWYYSDLELDKEKYCDKGDLLYAWSASFGPRIWSGEKTIYHYHIWKIVPSDIINKNFLYNFLRWDTENIKSDGGRGIAMIHITKSGMEKRKIPLPTLEIQKQLVAEIEKEDEIIAANRSLIDLMEKKIEGVLEGV